MKNARSLVLVLLLMSVAVLACGGTTPTQSAPQVGTNTPLSGVEAAATFTPIPFPSLPPTQEKLQLEIVQSQLWTDSDGQVRVNVLLRNPYDFPVGRGRNASAKLLNGAGDIMRIESLYFLDGISGGVGFFLPGETIAAHACFTCEQAPLTEAWDSVQFDFDIEDATDSLKYSTEVEVSIGSVTFDGDSPIFWINGPVKNNSASTLSRISARVFVYDQDGNLVGAAEASAWDVAAGATASFDGYGIGQAPDGPVEYDVTALGVTY